MLSLSGALNHSSLTPNFLWVRTLAPIAYGAIADHSNQTVGVVAVALTASAIIPMVLVLRPFLRGEPVKINAGATILEGQP